MARSGVSGGELRRCRCELPARTRDPEHILRQLESVWLARSRDRHAYPGFVALGRRMAEQGTYEGVVPRSLRPYDDGLVDYLRSLSGSREITVPVTDAAKEGTAEESEPESTATESVVAPYVTGSSGSSGSLVAPYLTD
jgi:hypothetical protein